MNQGKALINLNNYPQTRSRNMSRDGFYDNRSPRSSINNASRAPVENHVISNASIDKLLQKSPYEMLQSISNDRKFKNRLNSDRPISCHTRVKILQLLQKAFSDNTALFRQTRQDLASTVACSHFFNSDLAKLLTSWSFSFGAMPATAVVESADSIEKQQLLNSLCAVIIDVLSCRPSLAPQITLIPILFNTLENGNLLQTNSKILSEQLIQTKDRLKNLWKDLSSRSTLEDEAKANLNKRGRLPPNYFREISICPTSEEILKTDQPFLRKIIVDGHYEDLDHYLDVQFRLLREDCICPLREGIAVLMSTTDPVASARIRRQRVYEGVCISAPHLNRLTASLTFPVQFDVSHLKRVKWDVSRRLLPGSLVCLTSDFFGQQIYFATVAIRTPQLLAKGRLELHFESVKNPHQLDLSKEYIMMESEAYYEAYRHILSGLQNIRGSADMAFEQQLVRCEPNVEPPAYLQNQRSSIFDFSSLILSKSTEKAASFKEVNILTPGIALWPSEGDLGLDKSQYDALRLALTRSLAIIQGPPGTGKTFIGYKIVQLLLENGKHYDIREERQFARLQLSAVRPKVRKVTNPILVVCYTNHALDQFLEGILGFLQEGIVRVGGRCKNPAMTSFLLKNIANQQFTDGQFATLMQMRDRTVEAEKRMAEMGTLLAGLSNKIVNVATLKSYIRPAQIIALQQGNSNKNLEENFIRWLSGGTPSDEFDNIEVLIDYEELPKLITKLNVSEIVARRILYHTENADVSGAQHWLHNVHNRSLVIEPCPPVDEYPILRHVYHVMRVTRCNQLKVVRALLAANNNLPATIERLLRNASANRSVSLEAAYEISTTKDNGDTTEETEEMADFLAYDDDQRQLDDSDNFNLAFEKEVNFKESAEQIVERVNQTRFVRFDNDEQSNVDVPDIDLRCWQPANKKRKSQQSCQGMEVERILAAQPFDNLSELNAAVDDDDLWQLVVDSRWRLYNSWLQQLRETLLSAMQEKETQYTEAQRRIREINATQTIAKLRSALVIGMTTTGAAKYQAELQQVKPRVIVVEEAAEVLESHIVASLSSGCQHLILIGDHKQLRPNPSVYRLAKHFNLDISLFERLIRNRFDHVTLKYQHRMRVDIADTLMPHFYDHLFNHDSVKAYPNVAGMEQNMFFWTHSHPEDREADGNSKRNENEASMVAGLCNYLLQQVQYSADQITVLCAYTGQMFAVRDRLHRITDRRVRVAVVDNYQGEESEIIILSLVRSNNDQ